MKKIISIATFVLVGIVMMDVWEQAPASSGEEKFVSRREASIPVPGTRSDRPRAKRLKIENPVMGSNPLEAADNYLATYKQIWNVQPYHELRSEVFESPIGARVKYSVYQDGYAVMGLSIDVNVDAEMRVTSVENNYRPVGKVDTSEQILAPEEIVEYAGKSYFSDQPNNNGLTSILYLVPGATKPELAYVIPMFDRSESPKPVQVVFRARDGQVLARSIARAEF